MSFVSKYYKTTNVFQESLDRIRWVFDEFKNVVVNFSGGKDSTVIVELALMIAREKGRLPLTVYFIDQEVEWTYTIDMVKKYMYHPDVNPVWLQVPFKIENGTSFSGDSWLYCWKPGDDWIRPKDPISVKENTFGADQFHDIFTGWGDTMFPDSDLARLTGVRCEESKARAMGLTTYACYKWVTWGSKHKKRRRADHVVFHPIFDWSYTDVWKCIHEKGWPYNKLYDLQYIHGVPVPQMRVSNLHHETAVRSLDMLQEFDAPLYNKVVARLDGIDTYTKVKQTFKIKKLPFMFATWREYRDYLCDKLFETEEEKAQFHKQWAGFDDTIEFVDTPKFEKMMYKAEINAMLVNDRAGTKLNNLSSQIDREKKLAEIRRGYRYVDRETAGQQRPMGAH